VHFSSGSTTDHPECKDGALEGTHVTVIYSDNHEVSIRLVGNKTKVRKSDISKHSTNHDVLTYTATQVGDPDFDHRQYIREIRVRLRGREKSCHFDANTTALAHAVICSSEKESECHCP
jgi:hypothetical protein